MNFVARLWCRLRGHQTIYFWDSELRPDLPATRSRFCIRCKSRV